MPSWKNLKMKMPRGEETEVSNTRIKVIEELKVVESMLGDTFMTTCI